MHLQQDYLWSFKKIWSTKLGWIPVLQKVVHVSNKNAQELVKTIIGNNQSKNHQNPGQINGFEFEAKEK